MAQEPKPKRGMPGSLLYALIPGGFIVLVLVMWLGGWWTAETEDETEIGPGAVEGLEE